MTAGWPAWRWRLRRALARTDAETLLAIALLLLAIGLQQAVIEPLQALRNTAQAEQDVASAAHARAQRQILAAQSHAGSSLDSLLALLPAADARERQLDALGQQALSAGVTWLGADYTLEPEAALPVTRTTLRLTLRGPMPALRDFLAVLLAENPGLAVTALTVDAGGDALPVMVLEVRSYFLAPAPEAGA